jgi:hypothetical protein
VEGASHDADHRTYSGSDEHGWGRCRRRGDSHEGPGSDRDTGNRSVDADLEKELAGARVPD